MKIQTALVAGVCQFRVLLFSNSAVTVRTRIVGPRGLHHQTRDSILGPKDIAHCCRMCFRVNIFVCFSKTVVQHQRGGDSIRPQKRINATQFVKKRLQRDHGRASEIELINPLEGGNLPRDTSSTFKLKLCYTTYTVSTVYIQYIRYTPNTQ